MTPREFWHCLPRKLSALCLVHAELHDTKKKTGGPKTIDGVPDKQNLPNARNSDGSIGTPNAFIDQI
jgi:hypothetical protein